MVQLQREIYSFIVRKLHEIHKELSGRSEIRYGGEGYSFMIDVWVAKSRVSAYVSKLRNAITSLTSLSVIRKKLHKGKYTDDTLEQFV